MAKQKTPVAGELWMHASGKLYEIVGIGHDTITDETTVVYRPKYQCEHEIFHRPLRGHKKAWFSERDGKPRFQKATVVNPAHHRMSA